MTIYGLAFNVFAILFEGHADLITDIGFDGATATVELDTKHYLWRVSRGHNGDCLVQYSEGTIWNDLGIINASDCSFIAFE